MPNWRCIATNTSRPKRSSTSASIAEASETEMRRIIRSKTPENPAAVPSSSATTNAPIASVSGKPPPPLISSAAPGVDQAATTGIR